MKFNKIKLKKGRFLKPGEADIYVDGNYESYETIKNKYIWLNDNTQYGKSCHGKAMFYDEVLSTFNIQEFVKEQGINSVLDIGTGKGDMCNMLKEKVCDNVYGLDFAIAPREEYVKKGIKFFQTDAHNIPLPDKSIDLIVSFDLLEHLHPDYLEKTIDEMFRVGTKYMIHRVGVGPSKSFFKHVGQLHTIQEHPKFWRDEVFAPHAKAVKYFKGVKFLRTTLLVEI